MILEAIDLSKRYGRRGPWALRNVNLELPAGGVWGLVGPNGAGKSTLLRMWMGFARPTSGTARVQGTDPARDRTAVLSQVGYVPQVPSLYRDLTVGDHIGLAAHYRSRDFDTVRSERRLGRLGIPLTARAGTLSGGEAAQVMLAVALGLRAPVLLLDEPLASLDPLARREFIDVLLEDVHETKATVVLSSHVVSDIELACDGIVVLGLGRKMLADSIDNARATHRVVEGPPPRGMTVIGPVPGDGHRVLVRVDEANAAGHVIPDLESVVMAYLAAARQPQ